VDSDGERAMLQMVKISPRHTRNQPAAVNGQKENHYWDDLRHVALEDSG
jgi:hypothetical protein